MSDDKYHICVCVCTFKRRLLLDRLLKTIQGQRTDGLFTYSLLIVDNDREQSAREMVTSYSKLTEVPIEYYCEPIKNIALARNKAVENAKGDYLAFIDDDEVPVDDWLINLLKTCHKYKADGVLGPVKPKFALKPPGWVIRAKLFERPSYETGRVLHWQNTRTGNVLFKRSIFEKSGNIFNPEFKHSEDQDLFRRMSEKGYVFIWCDEAVVYEVQTSDRFKKSYFIKRALLRGNVSLRLQPKKLVPIIKSVIALSLYTPALPFLFIVGRHLFIKYLIKDFDHVGRLLAACKIDMQPYLS